MRYTIEPISSEYDRALSEIIKTVGAEFGAIGEGFGPSDAEVDAMSQHYGEQDSSLYLVAFVDGKLVGGCGIASFNQSNTVCG